MNLRDTRRAAGLTITKLAAFADMAASTVWMIETGRLNMRADEARRLAGALGIEANAVDELRRALATEVSSGGGRGVGSAGTQPRPRSSRGEPWHPWPRGQSDTEDPDGRLFRWATGAVRCSVGSTTGRTRRRTRRTGRGGHTRAHGMRRRALAC
ncbi:hypothetical protein CMK11_01390 [Candidatus Poribacteria bacterium]|nr:hypothetical protein [Candidatus Poribacteria bacterium]